MHPKVQTRTLAALLALGAATIAGTDAASRCAAITGWFDARRVERCRKNNWQYEYAGRFNNFEQRFLLEEMPDADYSHGSVTFIGSSVLKEAIFTNALSAVERRMIGNYSWGAAVHSQEFALVRYLVADHGLPSAGADRALVVLGLYYGSAAALGRHSNAGFFKEMLTYEGLYTYSPDGGLHDAPMSPLERSLRLERARVRQFLQNALVNWDAGLTPTWPQTPDVYRGCWRDYFGVNWKDEMRGEVVQLGAMLEYLQAHHIPVVGVVPPLASWQRESPYPGEFRSLVDPLLRANGVPILDLTELNGDEDFGDLAHLTFRGELIASDILLGLARLHLRRVGALPRCRPDALARPVAHRVEGGLVWDAPPTTKGLAVLRPGAPGANGPVAILASRSASFTVPVEWTSDAYVVEAFDAEGCSSPMAGGQAMPGGPRSETYPAEALDAKRGSGAVP